LAETANTAEVAKKISNDIFKVFFWEVRPQEDANFDCVLDHHTSEAGKRKKTHPCDVIFHYFDPYLSKIIYLHTDLKSYSKVSLKVGKIRDALNSMAMTIECASVSNGWRKKFPVSDKENYEVRGLLFVANHDNKAPMSFHEQLGKISKKNLQIARSQVIHVLGPREISNLYSIAVDIKLAIQDKQLSAKYRFFYPDLTLWKRQVVDDDRTAATIETLLSPYFILKHSSVKEDDKVVLQEGSLIYYSRNGSTVDEFIYLLDSLLRYQLVNAKEQVRIRIFNRDKDINFKNNFEKAKEDYCRSWGFHGEREQEIRSISIDAIAQIESNYCPDNIGWKEY
jgi:hypothetical protein